MRKETLGICFLVLVAFVAGTIAKGSDDITGAWKISIDSRQSGQAFDLSFTGADEELKCIMRNFHGHDELVAPVNREGALIDWAFTIATQRGEMKITFKGTIVNHDMIEGTVDFGGSQTSKWKAVRYE